MYITIPKNDRYEGKVLPLTFDNHVAIFNLSPKHRSYDVVFCSELAETSNLSDSDSE